MFRNFPFQEIQNAAVEQTSTDFYLKYSERQKCATRLDDEAEAVVRHRQEGVQRLGLAGLVGERQRQTRDGGLGRVPGLRETEGGGSRASHGHDWRFEWLTHYMKHCGPSSGSVGCKGAKTCFMFRGML